MTRTILITGARAPAALEWARAFRTHGIAPHLADSQRARLARWSNAPVRVHRHAPPRQDVAGFRRDMLALVAQLDPVAIIPTCEEVYHLAMLADQGQLGDRLFAPPLAVLRQLHDKHGFARHAADISLDVPDTHLLTDDAALAPFRADTDPWVFKRCFSRFGAQTLVRPDATSLATVKPTAAEPWIAQRRIRGTELCFHAVARAGMVRAFAAYQGQWRLAGGASYAFAPVAPDLATRLQAQAERIAASLSITGQFGCDAIVDADGRPWLIECNPRATSGIHLCAQAAVATVLDLPPPEESAGPRHNLPMLICHGLARALRHGRLPAWRHTFSSGQDVLSAPGDRLPLAGALIDTLGFALHAGLHRLSLAQATTRDIEWNGEMPA